MPVSTQSYTWKSYNCAYTYQPSPAGDSGRSGIALLLIHPIGVGLSNRFWGRFCQQWQTQDYPHPIYSPDLLGCGQSDMPRVAYYPEDWAGQLNTFLETVVQEPVVIVVQGALLPVAIKLVQLQGQQNFLRGLVLVGPPSFGLMTSVVKARNTRARWAFFSSILGDAFYWYARRPQFLQSFSRKQLFATAEAVDQEWLDLLQQGAIRLDSRFAVFSFLAGFWREDYGPQLANIQLPTHILIGEGASSISRSRELATPQDRLEAYLKTLPNSTGAIVPGRNVLPYEATDDVVRAVANFVQAF